ncbi:MAG: hypothetical protein JXJ17_01995 [Anaerolineae bacterium]|nr:hypothetical protein [Anaerolineae bacterium]
MAKLLCVAKWPDKKEHLPEYPITFELILEPGEASDEVSIDWVKCQTRFTIQYREDGEKELLAEGAGQMLSRDLLRLQKDLKALLTQRQIEHLTFVPVTPLFEMWVNRLSDDQYRVIVWQDLADKFDSVSNVGFQGLRFTSNRARLLGFMHALEADLEKVT